MEKQHLERRSRVVPYLKRIAGWLPARLLSPLWRDRGHQQHELQRAEGELRQLNQLHNKIFDNAPVAIYVVDRDLSVVKWNQYLEKLTAIRREQALGRDLLQLLPTLQREGGVEQLLRVMQEGVPYHELARRISYPVQGGEDVERYQDVTIYPLLDDDGSSCGAICILADVTLRVQAEESARQARQEMERSRQRFDRFSRIVTMGELTATLAHELGQPITAISSYARVASNHMQDEHCGDKLRELLQKIVVQAERAADVIEVTRDRVRSYEVELTSSDANALLQQAARLAEVDLASHGCELQLRLSPIELAVMVDRNQIEKVLLNLLRNAVEAVAGLAPARRLIRLEVSEHGAEQVRIAVIDQGDGVAVEQRQRLFEPFYTTKPQGLGIGLAICDSVVTAHGGAICYNQGPDGGAEFDVYLQRA